MWRRSSRRTNRTEYGARFEPDCAACGKRAATLEILSPEGMPQDWRGWSSGQRRTFKEHRIPSAWYRRYSGPGGSNGLLGDKIPAKSVERVLGALTSDPVDVPSLDLYDDAGQCTPCGVHYCARCWNVSDSGGGYCPNDHFKSLDPHSHP